jgi:hypothetical protein
LTKEELGVLVAELIRQVRIVAVQAVIEKALDLSRFDVEAVRLSLDAKGNGKREPREAVEVDALRVYDRPQAITRNYDQLLGYYSDREVLQ